MKNEKVGSWEFLIDPKVLDDGTPPLDLDDPKAVAELRAEILDELADVAEEHAEIRASSWEVARQTFVG